MVLREQSIKYNIISNVLQKINEKLEMMINK